jgi:hypothetical protein
VIVIQKQDKALGPRHGFHERHCSHSASYGVPLQCVVNILEVCGSESHQLIFQLYPKP